MNREQNLQIRLGIIAGKIETGDALHVGERVWLADLLKRIGSGEDVRDMVGFRVQKGGTLLEKPFWVSVHYRVLRLLRHSRAKAIEEVTKAWRIAESTADDYIRQNVDHPKEYLSLDGDPQRILNLSRWKAKCMSGV